MLWINDHFLCIDEDKDIDFTEEKNQPPIDSIFSTLRIRLDTFRPIKCIGSCFGESPHTWQRYVSGLIGRKRPQPWMLQSCHFRHFRSRGRKKKTCHFLVWISIPDRERGQRSEGELYSETSFYTSSRRKALLAHQTTRHGNIGRSLTFFATQKPQPWDALVTLFRNTMCLDTRDSERNNDIREQLSDLGRNHNTWS